MCRTGQVTVALHRRDLSVLFEDEKGQSDRVALENGEVVTAEEEDKPETKKKTLPWQKNIKKGKKASNKKGTAGRKAHARKDADEKKKAAAPSSPKMGSKTREGDSESDSEEEVDQDQEEVVDVDGESDEPEDGEKSVNNDSSEPEKDDDQLEKLQSDVALRRQRLLEGKSQVSHSVHCPYFPQDKQEYWWVYITDRKQQMLNTVPYHVTNLVEREEIQLKFTAPFKPGLYTYAVCLRSDSYFGFDQMKDIKVRQKTVFSRLTKKERRV